MKNESLKRAGEREERQAEETMMEETTHSAEEGVAEKYARTDRMTQKWTQRVEERRGTSQSHSRHRKGHTINIYSTDSD